MEPQNDEHSQQPGRSLVTVFINGEPKEIHRGSHTGAELKRLLGVDPTYQLDEDVAGELKPVADDTRVTIKGGEHFFSHVRTGGSSR